MIFDVTKQYSNVVIAVKYMYLRRHPLKFLRNDSFFNEVLCIEFIALLFINARKSALKLKFSELYCRIVVSCPASWMFAFLLYKRMVRHWGFRYTVLKCSLTCIRDEYQNRLRKAVHFCHRNKLLSFCCRLRVGAGVVPTHFKLLILCTWFLIY